MTQEMMLFVMGLMKLINKIVYPCEQRRGAPETRALTEQYERRKIDRMFIRGHDRIELLSIMAHYFRGFNDPRLIAIAQLLWQLQSKSMAKNHGHQKDFRELTVEEYKHLLLSGGVHADIQLGTDNTLRCVASFYVKYLGLIDGYIATKGGGLLLESSSLIYVYLDTLKLSQYQLCWVIFRTWEGLQELLEKLLNGKHRYGPVLIYSYTELREKWPEVWAAYTEGGTKEDDGRGIAVRPPMGYVYDLSCLPDACDDHTRQLAIERMSLHPTEEELRMHNAYAANLFRASQMSKEVQEELRESA